MKHKMVCYFIIAALAFTLLMGCSGVPSTVSGNVGTNSFEAASFLDQKVGVCIYNSADNFMSLYCDELVKYLMDQGFDKDNIIICDSALDESLQLTQVKGLIDDDVDVLIINPVNHQIAHSITEMAVAAHVPLVYINREPTADEESIWENYDLNVTYVGCDARQSGIYQGELLLNYGVSKLDINGDGSIQYFMLEGAPENTDAGFRTYYSVSTMKNAGVELDCLLDEIGNWNRDSARQITAEGLENGLVPEVIISNNDAMALGAIDALKANDLTPGKDVFVVGVDALPEVLDSIADGEMIGTVFNDYITQSHSAADAAINYLKGMTNEHYIGCDYLKVNEFNLKTIRNMQ